MAQDLLLYATAITYLLAIRKASGTLRKQRNPVYFFILTFGLFLMSRVFIAILVPDFSISQGTWIYWGEASTGVVQQTLILLFLFISAFLVVPVSSLRQRAKIRPQPVLARTALITMICTAPFYAHRGINLAMTVADAGYLATFTDEVKTPFVLNLIMGVFQSAYYVLVSAQPPRRIFVMASGLFLAISVFSLGSGQRTEFMAALILVYWCGAYLKNYEINIKIVAAAAIPMITLSIIINGWRLGVSIQEAALQEALSFIWHQGNTLPVVYGTLENSSSFLPYEGWLFPNKLLSCDITPYITGAYCKNGDVVVSTPGIWWQKLTYILDPLTFSEGGGLGGCVIAAIYLMFNSESYAINAVVFFLTSCAFFALLYKGQMKLTGTPFGMIYFVYLAHTLTTLPRAGFDALLPHPRLILGTAFIIALNHLIRLAARKNLAVPNLKTQ